MSDKSLQHFYSSCINVENENPLTVKQGLLQGETTETTSIPFGFYGSSSEKMLVSLVAS
jgi:hypothetical protein